VWQDLDLEARRATLATVLDHVVVHRDPTTGHFHPERVEIFWFGHGPVPPTATRCVPPPKPRRSRSRERYTLNEVAAQLGLSQKHIQKLVRLGALRGARFGQRWEITQSAIDEYLVAHRVRPTAH
jgi:excisionase family DNA binding protein